MIWVRDLGWISYLVYQGRHYKVEIVLKWRDALGNGPWIKGWLIALDVDHDVFIHEFKGFSGLRRPV